jgi:hypothetical protein
MRNNTKIWGLVAGAAVLVAGCNESRDTGAVTSKTSAGTSVAPPAEAVEERDNALVRVVNALPGGAVNIYAGDSAAFGNVAYKTATSFKEMPDDFFGFKVVKGANTDNPLAENREKLSNGGHYTVIALPEEGDAGKANLRVLDDELKPLTDGKARIRVVNAAAHAGEVSVYVRGKADALFDGINFKNEAGWSEIDPFKGTLEIRPEGKKNVLASIPSVNVQAGHSYTFVVAGKPGKLDIIKIDDNVKDAGQVPNES